MYSLVTSFRMYTSESKWNAMTSRIQQHQRWISYISVWLDGECAIYRLLISLSELIIVKNVNYWMSIWWSKCQEPDVEYKGLRFDPVFEWIISPLIPDFQWFYKKYQSVNYKIDTLLEILLHIPFDLYL